MNIKKNFKRFFTLSRRSDAGFTLVELIVVIAILAILAGVAIPAYSGYVKKAERAGDEQLLAAVNTAFAAACIDNGTDVSQISNAYAVLGTSDGNKGKVLNTYVTAKDDVFDESFDVFFAGNEESAFKQVTSLYFDPDNHVFSIPSGAYSGLVGTFDPDQIAYFNSSIFASLGFDNLMGQVDMATQVALLAAHDSTLGQLIYGHSSLASLAATLGLEEGSDEFNNAFQTLAQNRVNQMIADGADPSDENALYGQAVNEILANNAVLTAATNTTFDTNAFITQLANGNGKTTIKASMDTADGNTVALSQTAMAYALYSSYVSRNGGTPSNDVFTVLDTLESDGFMEYMSQPEATADANGYLAAMGMIEDASGDQDAVSNLLVNGFNNPELIALLTQEING